MLASLESLGAAYVSLGLFDPALDVDRVRFSRATSPDSSSSWLWYGHLLAADDDVEEYRELSARMLAKFRSSRDVHSLSCLIHVLTTRPDTLADWEPLVELARAMRGLTPDAVRLPAWLAMTLARAGRFGEAFDLRESLGLGTQFYAAIIHRRLGQAEEARTRLRRADEFLRDTIEDALANKGFTQSEGPWVEDWLRGFTVGREAHELVEGRPWPDAAWLRLQKARAWARVGEAGRSDALFAALLADRPDDAEVWLGRAQADAWLGRPDRAAEAAAHSVRLGRGTARGWESLGRSLAAAGRAADDAAAFARAADLARALPADDRDDHLRRFETRVALDRPEDAAADLSRALDLSRRHGEPVVAEVLDRLIALQTPYLRDRRWAAALGLVKGLTGLTPRSSDPAVAHKEAQLSRKISALYAVTGDRDGFTRHITAVMDGLRDDLGPSPAAELVIGATLAPWPAGDPNRVVALAEKVNARRPLSAAPYDLALAHLRAGRPEEALRRIEAADRTPSKGVPSRPLFDLVAAIAHHRLGHAAEACRLYDVADRWFRSQEGEPLGWWPNSITTDALSYEALRREAEALIVLDPAFPADPFAR